VELLRFLIEHGLNPAAESDFGYTVCDIFEQHENCGGCIEQLESLLDEIKIPYEPYEWK
jgi:hypothetical protein